MQSYLLLFVILVFVDARLGQSQQSRALNPKSAGSLHQDAFDKLGKKYLNQKPQSQLDVLEDVVDIVSQYCPENDTSCTSLVHESVSHEFEKSQLERNGIEFPDTFDNDVKDLLDQVYSIIDLADEKDLDLVIRELSLVEVEIDNLEEADNKSRAIGQIGVSIAIESTKLWHSAVNNSDHPFHQMIGYFSEEDQIRRTQFSTKISKLVRPDIDAATALGLEMNIIKPVEFVRILGASISASSSASITSAPLIIPYY